MSNFLDSSKHMISLTFSASSRTGQATMCPSILPYSTWVEPQPWWKSLVTGLLMTRPQELSYLREITPLSRTYRRWLGWCGTTTSSMTLCLAVTAHRPTVAKMPYLHGMTWIPRMELIPLELWVTAHMEAQTWSSLLQKWLPDSTSLLLMVQLMISSLCLNGVNKTLPKTLPTMATQMPGSFLY